MTLEAFLLADIAMLVGAGAVLSVFMPDVREAERAGTVLSPWGYLVLVVALSLVAIGTVIPAALVLWEIIRFAGRMLA